jgi:uncharacterized protein
MAQRRFSSRDQAEPEGTDLDTRPRDRDEVFSAVVGRRVTLDVERLSGGQAWLRVAPGVALIPTEFGDVPAETAVGSKLEVCVCFNAKGQPVGSLTQPALLWGEVRFLVVTKETADGAFMDWGMPQPLFVPKREQVTHMRRGDSHPVALTQNRDGTLIGTTAVTELLHLDTAPFEAGEWVHGEAWRNDPTIGLFVIVEGKWVGRVPATEPHQQQRGQAAEYRICKVLPDGKLELSLRATIAAEIPHDVEHVLATLNENPAMRVGDDTSPDKVRDQFGLSKKAFKRALGVLFKRGDIEFDAKGFARVRTRH